MDDRMNTVNRVDMGSCNAWLYGKPGHWLLVDSGKRITIPLLMDRLRTIGCSPEDIALAVVTHAHYDHVGGLGKLKKAAGIPVAIHRLDASTLENGAFTIPDGFRFGTKCKVFFARHLLNKALVAFDCVKADIVLEGERRLDDFGFPAAIIHTPGHSDGSISVLTDDGLLFAGDIAINQKHPGIWQHMSFFGTSQETIKKAWRTILDRGATHIYPGHGGDFPASELEQYC